jgi:hypothetical protein
VNELLIPGHPLASPAHKYTAELLVGVDVEQGSLVHWVAGEPSPLDLSGVRFAAAAEVGEPEGVRTVVFDLATVLPSRLEARTAASIEASDCVVYRFDADPGAQARALAAALEQSLGAQRCSSCLRQVALDGMAARWYPDIESFEEANFELFRAR